MESPNSQSTTSNILEHPRRNFTRLILIALLIVVTLVAYWSVDDHGFSLYDDQLYVVNNHYIQPGITWENIGWALTSGYASNWHPLTWVSHMLDYQLFGLNPAGHHLHNVFLHLLNSILVYLILLRLTNRSIPSAVVAMIFALHPLHVESVAWISERKDLLSAFFGLLTIAAYHRYTAAPSTTRYLVVMACFALGLMAKPMLVTIPFVLLLLDYWPLRRLTGNWSANNIRPLFYEKIPLLLLSCASSIATYIAQSQSGAMSRWNSLPLDERIANGVVSYFGYLKHFLWPLNLAVFYPHARSEYELYLVVITGVVLLAATLYLFFLGKRYPYLPVGWLLFLGMLVPVLGIVQVGAQAMADRYMYLPMVGLTIMIVWFVADLAKEVRWQRFAVGVAVLVSVLSLLLTMRQVGFWKDDKILFAHAAEVTERNWVASYGLGGSAEREGDTETARRYYEQAIAWNPFFAPGHFALGEVLLRNGLAKESITHFQFALEHNEQVEKSHGNLAIAFAKTDKLTDALEHLSILYDRNPHYGQPHKNLGLMLVGEERFDTAEFYLQEALNRMPGDTSLVQDIARLRSLRAASK